MSALLISGKHMNVLTVHILYIHILMSVLNVSEVTDPTFAWALNMGGHLIWAWQTLCPKLPKLNVCGTFTKLE